METLEKTVLNEILKTVSYTAEKIELIEKKLNQLEEVSDKADLEKGVNRMWT